MGKRPDVVARNKSQEQRQKTSASWKDAIKRKRRIDALKEMDFIENDLISRMAHASNFQEWWGLNQQRKNLMVERAMLHEQMGKSRIGKAMSDEDITEARGLIALYNKRRRTATQTIQALMRKFSIPQPDAARVFWTETKRADVAATHELGEEIGFTQYKVILSPSACPLCRKKTQDGAKIFSNKEMAKTGHGQFVPWHPNCYCVVVPYVE